MEFECTENNADNAGDSADSATRVWNTSTWEAKKVVLCEYMPGVKFFLAAFVLFACARRDGALPLSSATGAAGAGGLWFG